MPIIRPISDLRNKTPEIEEICVKENTPVFITKNGTGHLVVMSQKLFEEQQALLDLYEKLDEAEDQSKVGKNTSISEGNSGCKGQDTCQSQNIRLISPRPLRRTSVILSITFSPLFLPLSKWLPGLKRIF